jgi:hypothetical protein
MELRRVASLLLSFSELTTTTLTYALHRIAAGKRCARMPLAASFGATVLLHSEAFKKTLFLQLVDQTFVEKLFYGSVRYRAT